MGLHPELSWCNKLHWKRIVDAKVPGADIWAPIDVREVGPQRGVSKVGGRHDLLNMNGSVEVPAVILSRFVAIDRVPVWAIRAIVDHDAKKSLPALSPVSIV